MLKTNQETEQKHYNNQMLIRHLLKEINVLTEELEKNKLRRTMGGVQGDFAYIAYLTKEINDRKK
jgi:hypothetical protein